MDAEIFMPHPKDPRDARIPFCQMPASVGVSWPRELSIAVCRSAREIALARRPIKATRSGMGFGAGRRHSVVTDAVEPVLRGKHRASAHHAMSLERGASVAAALDTSVRPQCLRSNAFWEETKVPAIVADFGRGWGVMRKRGNNPMHQIAT